MMPPRQLRTSTQTLSLAPGAAAPGRPVHVDMHRGPSGSEVEEAL